MITSAENFLYRKAKFGSVIVSVYLDSGWRFGSFGLCAVDALLVTATKQRAAK